MFKGSLAHLESSFFAWKSFLIGGVDKKVLLRCIENEFSVGEWSKILMSLPDFTTQDFEELIDTIILTPRDFGYEKNPTTFDLFDPVRLAIWSTQNAHRLPEDCVVELLPAEAGPHIRNQYKEQPKAEILWVAMERITDSDCHPGVFSVISGGDGEQWFSARWSFPNDQWNLDDRFVFRLRRKK